jgi:hypothetical protein
VNQAVNRIGLAEAYIDLLLTENSRLHQTVGKMDRFFGDILADCSREVYEANMNDLTDDLEDLGKFLELHQEKIKILASALQ